MKRPLFLKTALFCLTASLAIANAAQAKQEQTELSARSSLQLLDAIAHLDMHAEIQSEAESAPESASNDSISQLSSPPSEQPSEGSEAAPTEPVPTEPVPTEPALVQSFEDVRYQELVEATESFLATLDEAQRATVVVPFESPFRTRAFCYVLARCNDEYVGLQMQDLSSEQKIALNNLLMKGLSGAGYSRAIQTMNREWLVEETENAHRADPERYPTVGSPLVAEWTPPPQRSAPNYYIAFFGEPGTMSPWGLRFEGHHLSFNLTFNGESNVPTVSTSPMFFGSSPMIIPAAPEVAEGEVSPYPMWERQEGQQLLHREAWLARSFLNMLSEQALAPGTWSALPDVVLAGGADVPLDADSYLEGERPGIAVADLSDLQRTLLYEFALEFLELQASHTIDVDAFKDNLDTARVWWYGDKENEQADLYFRIQSDRYLIELLQSNTFGVVSEIDSNHVHASFRDLTNDWDRNSLGAHIQQFHTTTVPATAMPE